LYNPQSLNRYSYVRNNPIRYNDPTGHKACDADNSGGCTVSSEPFTRGQAISRLRKYHVKLNLNSKTTDNDVFAIFAGVDIVGARLASRRGLGETASEAFGAVYDHLTIQWEGGSGTCGGKGGVESGGCTDGPHQIRFWSLSGHGQNAIDRMTKNVVHELGHAFDWITGRQSNDMSADFTRDALLRPNITTSEGPRWDWQQSPNNSGNEIFADMFIAWTYNAWNNDPANETTVGDAQGFMNGLVP
jgi:hypothetical protein